MHTLFMRDLLHKLANKLACIQGSVDCLVIGDIPEGPTREYIQLFKRSIAEMCMLLTATREAFYATYRQQYGTYKGEPPLLDKNSILLKRKDTVIVPEAKFSDDFWGESFQGEVIATTIGDGLISVKDVNDNCWTITANRVEKVSLSTEAITETIGISSST